MLLPIVLIILWCLCGLWGAINIISDENWNGNLTGEIFLSDLPVLLFLIILGLLTLIICLFLVHGDTVIYKKRR
jgi:hypothetical protein